MSSGSASDWPESAKSWCNRCRSTSYVKHWETGLGYGFCTNTWCKASLQPKTENQIRKYGPQACVDRMEPERAAVMPIRQSPIAQATRIIGRAARQETRPREHQQPEPKKGPPSKGHAKGAAQQWPQKKAGSSSSRQAPSKGSGRAKPSVVVKPVLKPQTKQPPRKQWLKPKVTVRPRALEPVAKASVRPMLARVDPESMEASESAVFRQLEATRVLLTTTQEKLANEIADHNVTKQLLSRAEQKLERQARSSSEVRPHPRSPTQSRSPRRRTLRRHSSTTHSPDLSDLAPKEEDHDGLKEDEEDSDAPSDRSARSRSYDEDAEQAERQIAAVNMKSEVPELD